MEKVLTIAGRQVLFKSTGAFLYTYKAQTGRDPFEDLRILGDCIDENGNLTIDGSNYMALLHLAWALAKTADPKIFPPMEWLDTFDEFPLREVMPELVDMLFSSLCSTTESKKKENPQRMIKKKPWWRRR